ncbi:hypothetical protein GYB59_15300 [bacterium]|nr:hypothetical protein [bacterium]
MREFAEQEIVIPDGQYQGRRYNVSRQPYAAHLLDAIDSRQWIRCFVTGPTQSGKTLTAFVLPIMYHLFEIQETVIVGLPTGEMAEDKYLNDLLPIIEASRYRDLLPKKGRGSQGGTPTLVTFGNGAKLRFMTGGGSDKKRAGFTSRVLVMTEIDGFDEAGGTSRESDKITQLEERTRAYGSRKRIYGECTVSIDTGRIWEEYTNGTASRLVLHCPHCGGWVSPEREHLRGFEDCDSDVEAMQKSHFVCPECEAPWSEDDRAAANADSQLLHKGQEVTPEGKIVGTTTPTQTLGFRWSAVHNMFLTSGEYGVDAWQAVRAEDEINAEKKLRQFVFAIPYESSQVEAIELQWSNIVNRMTGTERGQLPADSELVTAGVDVGHQFGYFTVIAWDVNGRGTIIDYGSFDVPSRDLGVDTAITAAVTDIRDWLHDRYAPSVSFVDTGDRGKKAIYPVLRDSPNWFVGVKGMGESQTRYKGNSYTKPRGHSSEVRWIGEEMHMSFLFSSRLELLLLNADYWKTEVHKRLSCPFESDVALVLCKADRREHMQIAKHLTAEKQVDEFVPDKGMVTKWKNPHGRENHLFDATYYAVAGRAYYRGRYSSGPASAKTVKFSELARKKGRRW